MTNPIGRRIDRLEAEVQKKTDPGYGPVFELIDDPHDPENSKRIQGAVRFKRDNPTGLIIHRIILRPPNGEPNWKPYIEAGTNLQIAEEQSLAREALLSKMEIQTHERG